MSECWLKQQQPPEDFLHVTMHLFNLFHLYVCVCVCVCFSHMPLSPAADTKHDRPRQQAVTNGNPTGSAVARDDDADDTPSGNSIVVRIGIPDLQQTVTHT